MGSTVAKRLARLPHNKKIAASSPGWTRRFFCVESKYMRCTVGELDKLNWPWCVFPITWGCTARFFFKCQSNWRFITLERPLIKQVISRRKVSD